MFVVEGYPLAVVFCIVTMFCWGSWANTQKLVGRRWRFELFYWDYVLGMVLAAVLFAFTLGSIGQYGRGFLADLAQADPRNLAWALVGGVIFNAANILLVAAIAIAGMSVAFPVGIGIALVLGVLVNYVRDLHGNPLLLFAGVLLVAGAIVTDARAYRKLTGQARGVSTKGLALSVACGILMGLFYYCVAYSMAADFLHPQPGRLTPYTAMVAFSAGVLASNFLFNTILMKWPVAGEPVPPSDYFRGRPGDHLAGIAGGLIWAVGMTFNIIASGKAGTAIAYGLGQGATMIAAFWGVFVWREFRDAPAGTGRMLWSMFAMFLLGLGLIVLAGM
jgi:glucose uptake protein